MKIQDLLLSLSVSVASGAILLGALGFFGKQIIAYFFFKSIELKKIELNKDLESYKQSLLFNTEKQRLELNTILESHKSELTLNNTKHSKLHDIHLEVVRELYKKIVVLERDFRVMSAWIKKVYTDDPEKEEADRIRKAGESYNDYLDYYTENKIFFSKSLGIQLDELRKKLFDVYSDYNSKREFFSPDYKRQLDERMDNSIDIEIPKILEELYNQFRELLLVK